jgi:hypothetical protein
MCGRTLDSNSTQIAKAQHCEVTPRCTKTTVCVSSDTLITSSSEGFGAGHGQIRQKLRLTEVPRHTDLVIVQTLMKVKMQLHVAIQSQRLMGVHTGCRLVTQNVSNSTVGDCVERSFLVWKRPNISQGFSGTFPTNR